MFVVHNCTLTLGPGGYDTVVVPGVYSADQFQSITNITRNSVLYITSPEHDGTIAVTDDGVQTTILVWPGVRGAALTDDLQVICYNDAPGISPGPAANVAVTNFPASQNINGAVTINGEVEVKNNTGDPLAVSGTVSVGNFPTTQPVSGTIGVNNVPASQAVTGTFFQAVQPVSGSVSVSNFPATQAVTGTFFQATQPVSGSVSVANFPATQPVSGSVSVSNFPATQNVDGTVDVGNFPATQTVDGSVTINNDSGSPVPVTFPSGVSVSNFPATQTVDGTVDVGNFPTTQTVDGSVSVSNFPTTQPVSGSVSVNGSVDVNNFPSTQTVDGSVSVSNFPASTTVSGTVDVGNFPATQTVDGSVSVSNFPATQPVSGSVSVSNFPATQTVDGSVTVSGTVDVGNFPASTTVDGTVDVGNFPATQTVDGSVSVSNFPATQAVTGTFFQATQPVSGSVSVSNFPATQAVTGTFYQATQPVSGTVTANQGTSPWVVSSTGGSTNVASFPTTSTDAFGRLRVSEPFTLFDSSFRYGDTGLWSTATATGGTAVYNAPQGLMDLNVTTTSGSSVQRQTRKVFAYQPGKSLLVMTTFVCASPKANLDQKIGYYGSDNGYFLEQDGLTTYFVERSAVSGAVTDTRVAQADWNVDPMDGTGPSGITLDISKAQILWMDLEWLGVGTVKMGFVINGSFYVCHAWDHANLITSTYITTASLPLSCEITNTGTTASASTFKQICATVISEGGYALTGLQQSVGTPVTTAKTLTTGGTFYPIVSIRLKTTRLDAIAILTAISIQGTGNNNVFRWEVRAAGTSTAGAWVSAGADSSVEYNLTGTGYTGGRVLAAGFTSSSNQGTPSINILKEALFTFQLERDAFTATPYEITVVVAGATGGTSCYASMDWEEVSR